VLIVLVDFEKLLKKKTLTKTTDPVSIFAGLDKESGKEYLRPPQESVLKTWNSEFRARQDVIVKLHTGQGKTLIGLLVLQSYLNGGDGPAVYLCPNNYLVTQTADEARAFGIKTVQFSTEVSQSGKPPKEFLNSEAILVTNCKKLFNGRSVFGVSGSDREPVNLGAIVIDDAHRSLDIIREAFSIKIPARSKPSGKKHPLYASLWKLFEETLRHQAPGTCTDISKGFDGVMAVPFWAWHDKHSEVLKLLSNDRESIELRFVWDLLKNRVDRCLCIFSGKGLEISPRLLPLSLIPSFSTARRRILLSATLTEDAFLVRDMGIDPKSVADPISSGDVKYSGERLIVMPTLVDTGISRDRVIDWISGLAKKNGNFGVVALTPSFLHAKDWESRGAKTTDVDNLYGSITDLESKIKSSNAKEVLVLVNEYDGVDLPDTTCRILCLDSLPSYGSLMDRYVQDMRPDSARMRRQLAQRVEQGMGRGIRGTSDWCIVVVTGDRLTDFLSEESKRKFLSKEAQLQTKIGEDLANEMKAEGGKLSVIETLISQCLKRNEAWKEYYKERMSTLEIEQINKNQLDQAVTERQAETFWEQGHYDKAIQQIDVLITNSAPADKGWFLQQKGTFLYPVDQTHSMETQLKAHTENERLFRPATGILYSKLAPSGASQAARVLGWIKERESYNALLLQTNGILEKLSFNALSDQFEEGIDELGTALGLQGHRPEKKTGEGPDNLWHIKDKRYWVIECKNMVAESKKEISKKEAGQLSNDFGWFKQNYEESDALFVMIHPANTLAKDAFLSQDAWAMREEELSQLKENTRRFFNSLSSFVFGTVTVQQITDKLAAHHLLADELAKYYLKMIKKKA